MDSIMQKAAKGNRAALTQLYEGSKQEIYFLCRALLRGSAVAISAAKWAFRSAFQAVSKGEVETEDAFFDYAVKQAASYCKKDVLKRDSHAFKIPPQKNFRISHVNEHYIDPDADFVDNYINCLPAAQRFALVLRLVGNMPAPQIAVTIGFNVSCADLLMDAEPENLGKVYRAIQAKGGTCIKPTAEIFAAAFGNALIRTRIPDELDKYVTGYIDSTAEVTEKADKKNRKVFCVILAVIVVIAAILIAVFAGTGNTDGTADENDTSETVTSSDTEQTDGDSGDSSAADDDADTSADASATAALDDSMIYYADIEIQDYGTITVQLDQESAPITAANFVSLAESGFYDGLTFHRIIEGFMMQGGDPSGDGTGGADETIVGEFTDNGYDNTLSHTRGAISMARSNDYNSASSQFFIVHEDSSASLDGQYAVFGYVIEGMDVVDAVCEAAEPTDDIGTISSEDQPVITSITIRTEAIK